MKKFNVVILALFLFCLFASPLMAQEKDNYFRLAEILEKSNRFYTSVSNYRAIFYKQERSEGKLQETEKIFLKFEKPFKIFMDWLNTEKKDLQVVYERGKHRGKLAIHKPGLGLGLFPVVFLDQNSPWVKRGSESYDIEDAGIGTFLADFSKAVSKARNDHQLKVNFIESSPAGEGDTAEVIFDGPKKDPAYFAHRVIVSFDSRTKLPVKMSLFDWDNQPTGIYSYENLQVNLASEDVEFKQQINRQLYRVYQGK